MLKSEAFCGQLIKITYGAYKGNVGIIYHTAPTAARVLLATKEAKKDWSSLYYVAYEDMESFYANTIPQVTPFTAEVTIDAKDNYHIKEGSAPNKHYDEHYASMVGLEPIELMQLVLSLPEFVGFLKGNIIKYTLRAGKKQGEAAEKDVAKAKRYIEWLMKLGYKMPINPKED